MNNKIVDLYYKYVSDRGFSPVYLLLGNKESVDLLNFLNLYSTYLQGSVSVGEMTLKDLRDSSYYGLKILLVDKLSFIEVVG